jgi:tRNA 2-thiouridine synthesizing protein A
LFIIRNVQLHAHCRYYGKEKIYCAFLTTRVSAMQDSSVPIESVDARGERCPMPLLMAKRALRGIPSGASLEVLSTDVGSERDFESFARLAGHTVTCDHLPNEVIRLTITKA